MNNWISWIFTLVCVWLAIHHGRAYKSTPTTYSAFMCAGGIVFAAVNLFAAVTG